MLMFIPTCGIVLLIRFFAVITKYTVLDEQRREAKEGKSQRKNPRSITRGARFYIVLYMQNSLIYNSLIAMFYCIYGICIASDDTSLPYIFLL